jgi:hypothetical protein
MLKCSLESVAGSKIILQRNTTVHGKLTVKPHHLLIVVAVKRIDIDNKSVIKKASYSNSNSA